MIVLTVAHHCELYILRWWILCYVSYISMRKVAKKKELKAETIKSGYSSRVRAHFYSSFNTITLFFCNLQIIYKFKIHMYAFMSLATAAQSILLWELAPLLRCGPQQTSVSHITLCPGQSWLAHECTPESRLGQSDALNRESGIKKKML